MINQFNPTREEEEEKSDIPLHASLKLILNTNRTINHTSSISAQNIKSNNRGGSPSKSNSIPLARQKLKITIQNKTKQNVRYRARSDQISLNKNDNVTESHKQQT